MTRRLRLARFVCMFSGLGFFTATLCRPPRYDGVWLAAVLLILAALACSLAIRALLRKGTP